MADKPSSVLLAPEDRKIVERVTRILGKRHGKVSFTFIVREALRALDEKLRAA